MKRTKSLSPIEKTSIIIFLMCFISYAVFAMTRNTYSAAIATLTSEGFLSKSDAGSINFGFYLVYGIAQVFGGVLADRFSPFKLLFAGILGATLANVVMASAGSYPIMLASFLYPRKSKNPAAIISILFLISVPLLFLLVPMGKTPLVIVAAVLIIVTTLMTTASQLLVFGVPIAFAQYGKSGTVAGFLNLFSSCGIMLSSYLYGYVADHFGWATNVWIWIAIASIACIACFIATPMWKKFNSK